MSSEIRDRVRKQIRRIIRDIDSFHLPCIDDSVDLILAIEGLAVVDRDMGVPTVEWTASPDSTPSVEAKVAEGFRRAYEGWVKEVKG